MRVATLWRGGWLGVVAACLAAGVLVGCVGSAGGAGTARLRVVVRDNHVREEGVECAGARPFRYVHQGASYTITGPDGNTVHSGELPAGQARNADPTVEWGLARIPTVCIVDLAVPLLGAEGRYDLRLSEGPPLAFDAERLDPGEPLVVFLE